MHLFLFHHLGSTKKQESVSSSDSVPACAACDDFTTVIPDVVIYSADAVSDDSRAALTVANAEDGGEDRDQSANPLVASATTGTEPPRKMRSLSTADFSAMPANSRSLPHLPLIAAIEVPGEQSSMNFRVCPVSRRSLSSLQLAGVRKWCDGSGLRPDGCPSVV